MKASSIVESNTWSKRKTDSGARGEAVDPQALPDRCSGAVGDERKEARSRQREKE